MTTAKQKSVGTVYSFSPEHLLEFALGDHAAIKAY
jgi:hypothetical protein